MTLLRLNMLDVVEEAQHSSGHTGTRLNPAAPWSTSDPHSYANQKVERGARERAVGNGHSEQRRGGGGEGGVVVACMQGGESETRDTWSRALLLA